MHEGAARQRGPLVLPRQITPPCLCQTTEMEPTVHSETEHEPYRNPKGFASIDTRRGRVI